MDGLIDIDYEVRKVLNDFKTNFLAERENLNALLFSLLEGGWLKSFAAFEELGNHQATKTFNRIMPLAGNRLLGWSPFAPEDVDKTKLDRAIVRYLIMVKRTRVVNIQLGLVGGIAEDYEDFFQKYRSVKNASHGLVTAMLVSCLLNLEVCKKIHLDARENFRYGTLDKTTMERDSLNRVIALRGGLMSELLEAQSVYHHAVLHSLRLQDIEISRAEHGAVQKLLKEKLENEVKLEKVTDKYYYLKPKAKKAESMIKAGTANLQKSNNAKERAAEAVWKPRIEEVNRLLDLNPSWKPKDALEDMAGRFDLGDSYPTLNKWFSKLSAKLRKASE